MQRVNVVVSGMVQGVGYRYSLRAVAAAAGASGWVRNRRDGTVEAEIEGPDTVVAHVVEWMTRGPAGARVDDLVRRETAPTGGDSFEVRPTL